MTIVIYGRPDCTACHWTKKWMDRLGLHYQDINIDADQYAAHDVRQIVRANKLNESLPLVIVSNGRQTQRWTGFRIDRIRGLREEKS